MKFKEKAKNIAFAVHDDKNTELIEWSYFNKEMLNNHHITACGNAGKILEGTLETTVVKLPEAPVGGCNLLSKHISDGKIDILIFFWNDTKEQLQKNDVQTLLSAALEANIIVAHNKVSAEYILSSPFIYN